MTKWRNLRRNKIFDNNYLPGRKSSLMLATLTNKRGGKTLKKGKRP